MVYNTDKSAIEKINPSRKCRCPIHHLNCMNGKQWLASQIGVWRFSYEKRDIRDKKIHPAVYPISLARRCIELFTHRGELVVDPFVGSGTTLVAANDLDRNAVGFDLNKKYVMLANSRIKSTNSSVQLAINDDAKNISHYIHEEKVSLILTSPPYANLLARNRLNKSRKNRYNEQYLKNERYSDNPNDLGNMDIEVYLDAFKNIFSKLYPIIKPGGHCVINVSDYWWNNKRIPLHILVTEKMQDVGLELRNTIIWDRTNVVQDLGIFGYPSNYITMGTTFEYILNFWKPKIRY